MSNDQQRTVEEIQQDLHRELAQALNASSTQPDPVNIDLSDNSVDH